MNGVLSESVQFIRGAFNRPSLRARQKARASQHVRPDSQSQGRATPKDALARLEQEFESSLLVVAGDVRDVARHAEKLRLAITTEECAVVLDHLIVQITVEQVEETINSLFPDRFVEP